MAGDKEGIVVWITGLSAAGKTTLAVALEAELRSRGRQVELLDGDRVRTQFSRDLGFSPADRAENVRRVAHAAAEFADRGVICLVSLISPLVAHRTEARQIIGADRFIEVYVSTSLAVCESRDPKGLYRRARSGALAEFTGISAPYEPPPHPDLALDTGTTGKDECLRQLIAHLDHRI